MVTPSDATVKLDGQTVKTKRVKSGTSVSYEVSKVGYTTQSGSISTSMSDAFKSVEKQITLVQESGD
ncbi:hypothetical protein DW939_07340 [Phocaeicola plebeius]|uniref:hypothetical protein n=1 Tax=Phocaeicola plebeius TaxID=310297 RepID=UPI000E50FA98|nr:hypothetical protein [Phocaeicola plebeius]RHA29819.1 hypothetical protein DW941_08370 [Phocaeicola plebeius]RHA34844.1 hypothetical protein DW939_07340 [Phocaeicola plebeius]